MSGFEPTPWFHEQRLEEKTPSGIRSIWIAPADFDTAKPTLLILYATPNGNTIEQTLGTALAPGTDWHFDIRHIAAQTRRLRDQDRRENVVLVCIEAEGLSWPAWRQKHADNAAQIRAFVEAATARLPGEKPRIIVAGHSGGGSFLFGYINGGASIPDSVERIAFLDANYSYSSADGHGRKLMDWLKRDAAHRLFVLAYDDRNITLDGKKIIGPTGGTYRATHRMLDDFHAKKMSLTQPESSLFPLTSSLVPVVDRWLSAGRQAQFLIHRNPDNKILHTALVGEMNGYLAALTWGSPEEKAWGTLGGPRAYTDWIQPAFATRAAMPVTAIPGRPADSPGGSTVMKSVETMPLAERETYLSEQILAGNVPNFLRTFRLIQTEVVDGKGVRHTAVYEAAPDYLAVGSDADFVRVPLTPMTARRIAEKFDCVLPTRKMVNDIYLRAEVRLEPRPLTEAREAASTFVLHNTLIEKQREGKALGPLVAGIKKDVVETPLLEQRAGHVAICGWHHLDGIPIQPLTTVHRDTYVDYSHGIRLIHRALRVDGKPTTIESVLNDPDLRPLLTDENP